MPRLHALIKGCEVTTVHLVGSECNSTEQNDGTAVVCLVVVVSLFVVILFVVMFGIDFEYAYAGRWGCFAKTDMRLEFSDVT